MAAHSPVIPQGERTRNVELSLAEIKLLIECIGVTRSEYGDSPELINLAQRLRELRARREAEIERGR
jgi:hypothetical protein